MEGRLLLNVIVAEGSAVFKLLAGEDESLLIGRNALLILDLSLHVVNGVRRLDLKSDRLSREGLDENLHTTAETEDQMKSGLLLDVVIRKGAAVLELLTGEDKTLLVGRNALLVLNLGLDVVNGVGWLDLEGDGLASESLHKDLHATAETEDEMESGLLLDVIVGEGSAVFELLASEDQSLLIGRDALLVLDLGLDVVNGVRRLDLKSDSLSREGLYENLHSLFFGC